MGGEKRWNFGAAERRAGGRLATSLRISPLMAQLLVNRGVREVRHASAFLRPELKSLIDPSQFREMPKAVARIEQAIRGEREDRDLRRLRRRRDHATAILFKFFRMIGKTCSYACRTGSRRATASTRRRSRTSRWTA